MLYVAPPAGLTWPRAVMDTILTAEQTSCILGWRWLGQVQYLPRADGGAKYRSNRLSRRLIWIAFGDSVISTSPHDLIAWWGGAAFDATALLNTRFFLNYDGAQCLRTPNDNRGARAMQQRHGARWNVGFCDTHVETLRPVYLFNFSNDITPRRWNRDHQPHKSTSLPPP